VNLTTDTHPIHLHQVRFQILDRQPFLVPAYVSSGTLSFRGPASPPTANESGWKDTVGVEGRPVTRIIVRFDGYGGRFVWHCHTLEHAANEMMRPYDSIPETLVQNFGSNTRATKRRSPRLDLRERASGPPIHLEA
jgi:spore coat protein A